jgi:energy-coupling factor transport system ATP-binding protein
MDVSIRDLHFTYPNGVPALRGISLELRAGGRVAIIGENGSGKTTLAKHLNALLRPTRGEIYVGDWDTRTHTAAQLARRVGFLFQNPDEQIFKNRVADEVAFGPRQLGLVPGEMDRRVDAALARAGLGELREEHPYELLPAQRKWLALASVLVMDTPILVLDEPTTGQDARGLARLGALIAELSRAGKTIVTITHDIDFCAEQFERVIVMKEGRVLIEGDVHQVLPRADILAETFVEPPQITRLGAALHLQEPVTTVDEFLTVLSNDARFRRRG